MSNITNCKFAYKCDKTWSTLLPISSLTDVRFCSDCQTPVHLSLSEEDFQKHAQLGHCVTLNLLGVELQTGFVTRKQ